MPASSRVRGFAMLPFVFVLALVATLLVATSPSADAMTRAQRVGHAFTVVRHQQGDPYSYGAAGPNRFDCSGLMYYSFRRAGFRHMPRTTYAQAAFAHRIRKSHLHKGDLVFFYSGRAVSSNVSHVGIFAGWRHGRRTIIHAPHSGTRVHRAPLWTSQWFAGTLR